MSDQSTFTDQEWETLTFAPLWAADFVGRADEDVDRREAAATLRDLSRAYLSQEPLVREVFEEAGARFADLMARLERDPRTYEQGLEDAREVLDSKASAEEGKALKRQLLGIGVHVARSSGASGESVSEEEKERLATVAAALGISPDEIFRPQRNRD